VVAISRPLSLWIKQRVNHEVLAVGFDHRRARIAGHDLAFAYHRSRRDPANERARPGRLWQRSTAVSGRRPSRPDRAWRDHGAHARQRWILVRVQPLQSLLDQSERRRWTRAMKRSWFALGAENAAVARLDVVSLRLHRLWIAFYQLDGGERPAPCLLLHEPVERAHAVGVDETLLCLDAEQEALEQACRVGTGRGFKDGTRSDDERRALAGIDDFHRRTTFSQQQELGLDTVGLHGTLAAGEPVRRIARWLHLHDLLRGEPLEIRPAQIPRERKCRGEDGAAIVRISFDDFALPSGIEQIGESRRRLLGLDQISVVANWAERGECRRVHAVRIDLFRRQVL